jgi:hypothetical protein
MGNRIFYACQNVELSGPSGDKTSGNPDFDSIHGLQSVGMSTNFNLEPIYQLGQLELYDNYEEIPEVEITLNKVLDGNQTIFAMAMGTGNIVNIANNRTAVRLSLFPDNTLTASGTPTSQVLCTPAYLSQVTYTFPTEGNFTEEVTLVSNNKVWTTGTGTTSVSDTLNNSPRFTIMRRGQFDKTGSILPTGAGGVYSSGSLPAGARVTNITVTVNLGREQLRELGSRVPYLRYVNFPLEITSEFEVTARENGDLVGVSDAANACTQPKALANQTIVVKTCDGMVLNLGSKNKLTSVNFQGGDTGGGNATLTYSYQTFNDFIYTAPTGISGSNSFTDVVESGLPTASDFFT